MAESYVPDRARARRALPRDRASLFKTRTEIKNRIRNLLDKYDLKPELQPIDKTMLDSNVQLLDALDAQVEKVEIASIAGSRS